MGSDWVGLIERIKIDPEFASLIPPLSPEEHAQLEMNLLQAMRCLDPWVVWKDHDILLDGHHRLPLCKKHGIPFDIVEVDLPDRQAAYDWIVRHQLGRRSNSSETESYLRGKMYEREKQSHGGSRQRARSCGHGDRLKPDEALAAKYKVAPKTIRRDAAFAAAVDVIGLHAGAQMRERILSRGSQLSRKQVNDLAKLPPKEIRKAIVIWDERAKQKLSPATSTRSKRAKRTVTLPVAPQAFAKDLLRQLGRLQTGRIYLALAKALQGGRGKES
jgi:hypothetical protein